MSHAPTATELYLRMLTEHAPPGTLLDVRYRLPTGDMARFFLQAKVNIPDAAKTLTRIGRQTDVYVGCALRLRPSGTRKDIAPAHLLWADCDGPAALAALADFPITPSVIVTSGSPATTAGRATANHRENAHAYWPLTHPLAPAALEEANRRLAHALGADPICTDATRILRVPGTHNFKHDPARPVRLSRYTPMRHNPEDLLALLPELHVASSPPSTSSGMRVTRRDPDPARGDDPLQAIDPRHYVRVLTGQDPGRDNKIHCPFHDDKTPSLHAYPTPEQGWTCFACKTTSGRRLGGDIYTLAALLWSIPNRSQGFYELRERLDDLFAVDRRRAPLPVQDRHPDLG